MGGTHYYVKSLIYGIGKKEALQESKESVNARLDLISEADLWSELSKVDPLMAEKLHPNDTRRIRRSLEVSEIKK